MSNTDLSWNIFLTDGMSFVNQYIIFMTHTCTVLTQFVYISINSISCSLIHIHFPCTSSSVLSMCQFRDNIFDHPKTKQWYSYFLVQDNDLTSSHNWVVGTEPKYSRKFVWWKNPNLIILFYTERHATKTEIEIMSSKIPHGAFP